MAILTPKGRRSRWAASTLSPVSGLISVAPTGNAVAIAVARTLGPAAREAIIVGVGLGGNSGTWYAGAIAARGSAFASVGVTRTLVGVDVGSGKVRVASGVGVPVGAASVGIAVGTVGVAEGGMGLDVGAGAVGVSGETRTGAAVGVTLNEACGLHPDSARLRVSKAQQTRERGQAGIIDSVARSS